VLKDLNNNVWECKCGKLRKAGRGYGNLLSHVRKEHPTALTTLYEDSSQMSTTSNKETFSLFFSKKTVQIRGWIDYVVLGLQLFNVVENNVHRRFAKFDAISLSSLMKYLKLLTIVVEEKIAKCLPSHFALVFDG